MRTTISRSSRMAIAVVGGIAFSTLLTLFVVPSAYVVMHTAADRIRALVLTPRGRRVEAVD